MDRYYIERFIERYSSDIHGDVLEIGDARYTRQFGGRSVRRSEVLHVKHEADEVTIVGDLATGAGLGEQKFDCFIATQTLQFIYDVKSAVVHIHRVLKPGGVAIVTVPCISQISRFDMEQWGEYWRFTGMCAGKVFSEVFGDSNVEVTSYGNVLAAVSLLHGFVLGEVRAEELDYRDQDYEVLVGVRATRDGDSG